MAVFKNKINKTAVLSTLVTKYFKEIKIKMRCSEDYYTCSLAYYWHHCMYDISVEICMPYSAVIYVACRLLTRII